MDAKERQQNQHYADDLRGKGYAILAPVEVDVLLLALDPKRRASALTSQGEAKLGEAIETLREAQARKTR